MKGILSCMLLFLTGLAFSQNSTLERAVDIHFQNLTLEECLGLLDQQDNIRLSYSSDWLPKGRQFTYRFKAIPLNTILNILLRDTELSYAEAGSYIAIRPSPGEVPTPLQYTLSGVVEDAKSGERLTGVNIYQPNTDRGTTTNENGFFSISLPADSVDLIFSYVGYSPLDRSIGLFENQQLLIPLQPSTTLSTVEVKANATPPSLPPVEGSNQQPRISGALIEEMPAILGEGDALQALDLLPGVQAGTASLGSVNVRGGDNGHNLFLLDGAQVYNPNHLLGVYSVFNGSAVKDVELIKGAIPAQYGGRLSSVITVNGREGNFNEFKAEGSVGLIAAKVMIEGPIKKGKSSFLLSGRRSIWDWLARPVIKLAADTRLDVGYHFGDLNFKYKHKISERDDWSFSLYLGEDKFKYFEDFADHPFDTIVVSPDSIRVFESRDISDIRVGWSNKVGSLNWNHVWNDRLFSNASLSYSAYRFDLFVEIIQKGLSEPDTSFIDRFSKAVYYSGINDLSLRCDFDWNWKQNLRLRYGGRLIWHHYQPQSSGNGLLILADDRVGNAIPGGVELKLDPLSLHAFEKGFYGEVAWDINRRWQLFAGAHLAGFNYGKDWFFSLQPRLRTNYELPGSQRIFGSVINVQQYAHLLTNNNFNLPTDIWVPANEEIGPESSWQFGLGWEKNWGIKKYQVSLEAYYNHLDDLVTFIPYSSTFQENNWEDNLVQGKGRSYGLEFLLRKNAGRVTGLLSYHLSWAERQFPGFNDNNYFPHRNNRRHQLAAMANIALGPKTKFNIGWHFSTGNYITISDQRIPVVYNSNDFWSLNVNRDYTTVNNAQMPNYHRLDINFTFLKKRENYERKWSVGFFNVYNRLNPTLYTEYVDFEGNRSIEAVTIFTIIPSVNYQLKFQQMRIFLLLTAFCGILIASCSTDLQVDLPPRKQDLVVYAFINPNDTIASIFVNRTAGLKEDLNLDQTLLNSPATVTLWDGSELLTAFDAVDDEPFYTTTIAPFGVPGQTYLMRAEHPDFGISEARSTLPREVDILEVKALQNFYSRDNELVAHGLEVTFEDPIDVTNLYSFSFFNDQFGSGGLSLTELQLVDVIAPGMPELESIPHIRIVTLSDENFNGQRVSLRFRAFSGNNQPPSENAYLKVRFLDTPEYFHIQSLYSPVEIELEPIVDPSPAFTNFNQGFGVFSLFLERNYSVDQKREGWKE